MKSQISFKDILLVDGTLDDLPSIAKKIVDTLPKNAVVLLKGNLAAGKTTLVKAIANEFGLSSVSSPTFSLQQIYGDNIFHYDFYRIDFEKILQMGLFEEFEKSGLHFVEWPSEELIDLLYKSGFKLYLIEITPKGDGREYKIKVADEI